MLRRFAQLKVFLSSVLRRQPSKRKLAFLVARHCVLVPNQHAIPVRVQELRAISPRHVLRFMDELNVPVSSVCLA
jgi:hypothetical protein